MVYRLTLAYRGTEYAGWQRQKNALAVQQVVEEALARLLGEEVRIAGAGRTDAGVHARGQVAHFVLERDFPAHGLIHGTNHHLPEDIRILAADRMPADFHARKSATAKEYRYHLIRASVVSPIDALFAVQAAPGLDLPAMEAASRLVAGSHDFSAFALSGGSHKTSTRRVLRAEWLADGERLTWRVIGDGFLRGMVRSLVGTLLEVGGGQRSVPEFERLLDGAPRSEAGPTAPAPGLVLETVYYPEDGSDYEAPAPS